MAAKYRAEHVGSLLRPQELLRAPSAPRVEQFLLQFSQDHEVTLDEVDIMLTAYAGLDNILGRALKSPMNGDGLTMRRAR